MTGIKEEWRPVTIPGFEQYYEVSSEGRVRGVSRTIKASNRVLHYGTRLLKQNPTPQGYPQVTLCNETKRSTRLVHRLVAEAFLGPIPPGMEVLHINGLHYDARLSNIRYGTHQENIMEAIEAGRHNRSPDYEPVDWKSYRAEAKRLLNQRLAELETS